LSAVLCSALIVGAAVGAALFVNVEGSARGRDATALGAAKNPASRLCGGGARRRGGANGARRRARENVERIERVLALEDPEEGARG